MKKIVTTLLGGLLVLYMALYMTFNNINAGSILLMLFGLTIVVWHYLPRNKVITVLKRLFVVFSAIYIGLALFIAFMSQTHSAKFDENAVIVLGCGLHGNVPSGNLADRLNRAIEYHEKNPKAYIVVSGGQGPQEVCTEAEAMEKYLLDKNVPMDVIIKEDKSTSTTENYGFSKAILDEKLGEDYTVTYITNSFHSYRAGRLAYINGLDARAYNAVTRLPSLLPNYCREVLAVLQLWIFGK